MATKTQTNTDNYINNYFTKVDGHLSRKYTERGSILIAIKEESTKPHSFTVIFIDV